VVAQPAIKVVFFDIGGVLVDLRIDHVLASMAQLTGRPSQAIERHMEGAAYYAFERGEIRFDDYFQSVAKALDGEGHLNRDNFEQVWLSVLGEETPVAGYLAPLRVQAKVWLLTNTNHIHMPYLEEHYSFMGKVDGIVASCRVGCRKPEREIYERALGLTQCAPQEALFIDDRQDNVEGANELGIHAHQYTNDKNLRTFLTGHGFKAT